MNQKERDKVNPRHCTVCGKIPDQGCSRIPCPERKAQTARVSDGHGITGLEPTTFRARPKHQ